MEIKQVKLFFRPGTSEETLIKKLEKIFKKYGLSVGGNPDLIITLGGDGTILGAVREMTSFDTPIFGINLGNLGFLTSTNKVKDFEKILKEEIIIDERMLLEINLKRVSGETERFVALNDATVSHTGIAKVANIEAFCGKILISRYRADGVILSTPTGSTAYNLSAGGSIIHPNLEIFSLTPVAPTTFSQKSIVLKTDKPITLKVPKNETELVLSIDGQIIRELKSEDEIVVSKHPEKVKFVRFAEENYFEVLKEKLSWGN